MKAPSSSAAAQTGSSCRIVEIARTDIGADFHAAQAKPGHRAAQLRRGEFGRLHRYRRHADETPRMLGDRLSDLVVLQSGAGGAELRLFLVIECLRGRQQQLHADIVLIHLAQTPGHIPQPARHRLLHDLAVDLQQRGGIAADVFHDRRDAWRYFRQQLHRLVGQDVSVDVDGRSRGHAADSMEGRNGTGPRRPAVPVGNCRSTCAGLRASASRS